MATIIDVEIVRKPPDQIGFVVHPRRWAEPDRGPRPRSGKGWLAKGVERFFTWVSRNRRPWKDPEATLASANAFLYAASVMILIRRLPVHDFSDGL